MAMAVSGSEGDSSTESDNDKARSSHRRHKAKEKKKNDGKSLGERFTEFKDNKSAVSKESELDAFNILKSSPSHGRGLLKGTNPDFERKIWRRSLELIAKNDPELEKRLRPYVNTAHKQVVSERDKNFGWASDEVSHKASKVKKAATTAAITIVAHETVKGATKDSSWNPLNWFKK